MRLARAALVVTIVAVAGCSSGTSPAPTDQPARYGIAIFWSGGTFATQTTVTQKCGLGTAYRQGPRTARATGDAESLFRLPSPVLTQRLTTCLSASPLVKLVDILGGPAGTDR